MIKGFQYQNAFHCAFHAETAGSDTYDNLLVTLDNVLYEAGRAAILPIWSNSDGVAQVHLIGYDHDNSDMKDQNGISFILDQVAETMTFQDKSGHIRVQALGMKISPENGQIVSIWGDPVECDNLDMGAGNSDILRKLLEMDNASISDQLDRIRAIHRNLQYLVQN